MQPEVSLGKNRTGVKASPIDAVELQEMHGYQLEVGRPPVTAEAFRASYMSDETVGSIPPPTSVKGMVGATAQALGGHRMHVLLDKIAERLAFERSGTRLYDAALLKIGQLERLPEGMSMAALQEIRAEAAAHFRLLADAIARFGGVSTSLTPCADVTGVHGLGLLQALHDARTPLAQAL